MSDLSTQDTQAPIVEMRDVTLAFGEKTVLEKVNLTIQRKERVVVMGQSGVGKSTLLRLIMGILLPTSGKVYVFGKDVQKLTRSELNKLRRKMSLVYQYSALISSMSVYENLALPLLELTDTKKAEIDKIINEKLELVGMPDVQEKLPSELSGGMRKRVALARALVINPEIILFDEPSAGLDPVISAVIDALIIDLADQSGTTGLIVTHEMDSAFHIATRMAMLFKGTIIADGTPEEFKNSKNAVVHQFVHGLTDGPILEESRNHASPP